MEKIERIIGILEAASNDGNQIAARIIQAYRNKQSLREAVFALTDGVREVLDIADMLHKGNADVITTDDIKPYL